MKMESVNEQITHSAEDMIVHSANAVTSFKMCNHIQNETWLAVVRLIGNERGVFDQLRDDLG